jgi:AcrR family transcriptional regulator
MEGRARHKMTQREPELVELASLPPRERIVYGTMICLERDGMDALTVRAIAREAGVNVAAVNYYFGSKERLLEEVRTRQLAAGFSDPVGHLDAMLAIPDLTEAEALQQFLAGFIRDMAQYPRTTEAYLHDALTRQDYGGPTFVALNGFLEDFLVRTRDLLAEGDDLAQRLSVTQLWSAILFLGMLPRATDPFMGRPLIDDAVIDRYAARLVVQFFPRA